MRLFQDLSGINVCEIYYFKIAIESVKITPYFYEYSAVAQLVEQEAVNFKVPGSSPGRGAIFIKFQVNSIEKLF